MYTYAVDVEVPGDPSPQYFSDSGSTFVRVEDGSPYGAGWTLSNHRALFRYNIEIKFIR